MHLFSKENIWSNPQQFPAYSNDPVIQTRTIILWTELFPKKRREKIQGEILQSSSSTSTVVFPQFYKNYKISSNTVYSYSVSTCNPATPRYSTYRINSSTRILQEILQLQGSSRADQYKASSSDCSPCLQAFYTAESSHKAPYSIPGPYSISRLPVNSSRQKQHSKRQPASTQSLQ